MANEQYDVVIIGGGPAGLAAALNLGRARKRVLLCDAGPRRNAAALHIHGFVTRDGTPPAEFRRIAREQLAAYPSVALRDEQVAELRGELGHFHVGFANTAVEARRILLCAGMIDEMPELEGFRELWGHAIFQCPYCHAWEQQDRRFGYLLTKPEMLQFALLLRGWTSDVAVFTNGRVELPPDMRARLVAAGVRIEQRAIARLRASGQRLVGVELEDGDVAACEVLFAHPRQHQVALVRALELELDDGGYVKVDAMTRETSTPGIHAAGDLCSPAQAASLAASAGVLAAGMINHSLTLELAISGDSPRARPQA